MRPRIAVTPGEPAGVGPDLLLQMLRRHSFDAELVAVADPGLLERRARLLGIDFNDGIQTSSVALKKREDPGVLQTANAEYVLETIKLAVEGCLSGEFDAMVTGPVQKSVINAAGYQFTGHTEYIARLCSVSRPVMMLVTPGLRVALVTTHIPLKEVADAVSTDAVYETVSIVHRDLVTRFGIEKPSIYVCGINPHAGEDGFLGREEIEVLSPALEKCKTEGMNITGPIPADTMFIKKHLDRADAVLSMYHDQGLPVLKSMGFGRAVNVTLGLPVIRTSVDHGTALDLAGSGKAHSSSLEQAVNLALNMIKNSESQTTPPFRTKLSH